MYFVTCTLHYTKQTQERKLTYSDAPLIHRQESYQQQMQIISEEVYQDLNRNKERKSTE